MLACNAPADLSKITYPCLASTKLDGLRCLITSNGTPVSRTLRPIRNKHIASILSDPALAGLDGELVVGDPAASDCMRRSNSGIMSYEGTPDFTYYVFDYWNRTALGSPSIGYDEVQRRLATISHPNIVILQQYRISSTDRLEALERSVLDDGYEGLVIRPLKGHYKFGRSTAREGLLLKLKRYTQSEARIIGMEELLHNANEPTLDERGYTTRSQAMDGKIGLNTMGALIVEGEYNGTITSFRIGTGFTAAERDWFWTRRDILVGAVVTFKFFPSGSKDRPRHPVYISLRDIDDL